MNYGYGASKDALQPEKNENRRFNLTSHNFPNL